MCFRKLFRKKEEKKVCCCEENIPEGQPQERLEEGSEGMSLKDSIAKGLKYKNDLLTKHEISSWLGHKYKDAVIRNERDLTTAPGRGQTKGLPLADTHYAILEDGRKVCFAFVYELEENHNVFMLLKMSEACVKEVKKIYPDLQLSAFPKSYTDKWYTVFVDDTFKSKLDVYTLLEYVMNHVGDQDALSLASSLALAYSSAGFAITKKEIGDWLISNYKDIEPNFRDLYTKPGRGQTKGLPLADTHYRVSGKKKVCFAYIYELDNGVTFCLLKLNGDNYKAIHKYCKEVVPSAFPKSYGDKWYTCVIDKSFIDKNQVFHMVEYAYEHVFDK